MTTQRCLVCNGHSHLGDYACEWCREDIRKMLREIELYVAWLPIMAQPGRSGDSIRAPGYESRPPARLSVLVLLDPRTQLDVSTRPFDPVTDDDPDNAPRSVLMALHSQAQAIREDFGHQEPTDPPTMSSVIGYLLTVTDRCAQFEWVPDYAEFVKGLHRDLRAVVGDRPPRPLAPCMVLECDGAVFWSKDVPDGRGGTLDAARCATCGRQYYGTDLYRLRTQEVS